MGIAHVQLGPGAPSQQLDSVARGSAEQNGLYAVKPEVLDPQLAVGSSDDVKCDTDYEGPGNSEQLERSRRVPRSRFSCAPGFLRRAARCASSGAIATCLL